MVTSTNKGFIDPSGSQGGAASIPPSTQKGRTAGPPFYRLAQKYLHFDDMPSSSMECDDEDEDEVYFPTSPLDDEVWSKEPIPDRDLCTHMASGK